MLTYNGGAFPRERFYLMPWAIVRNRRIVARAWTREGAEGATGWAGTYRGASVVPVPVIGRTI